MLPCLVLLTSLAATGWARSIHYPRLLDYQQRNLNTIQSIYNRTVYPNSLLFSQYGSESVPNGLFNENPTGRITPIGNFTGFQDSVEYFFALTPPPAPPTYATWTSAKIVAFTSGCPEVASSVVYGSTVGVNPNASSYGKYVTTLKQIAFWKFDHTGAVLYYDAWLPNLKDYQALASGIIPSHRTDADQIQLLCGSIQQHCVGNNAQYNSTASCVKTLSRKPFGQYDEIWGDNVICRIVHILLTRIRPDVHCSHVGPTGGGKCVNVQYNDVYFDDQALFDQTRAETFMCEH